MVTGFRSVPSRRRDVISSSSALPMLSSSSLVHFAIGVLSGVSWSDYQTTRTAENALGEPASDGSRKPPFVIFGVLLLGTLLEDILCDRYCRKCVGPTSIKGKLRDHFRGLRSR